MALSDKDTRCLVLGNEISGNNAGGVEVVGGTLTLAGNSIHHHHVVKGKKGWDSTGFGVYVFHAGRAFSRPPPTAFEGNAKGNIKRI